MSYICWHTHFEVTSKCLSQQIEKNHSKCILHVFFVHYISLSISLKGSYFAILFIFQNPIFNNVSILHCPWDRLYIVNVNILENIFPCTIVLLNFLYLLQFRKLMSCVLYLQTSCSIYFSYLYILYLLFYSQLRGRDNRGKRQKNWKKILIKVSGI